MMFIAIEAALLVAALWVESWQSDVSVVVASLCCGIAVGMWVDEHD